MKIFKHLVLCFAVIVFCLCPVKGDAARKKSKEEKPSAKKVLAVMGEEEITLDEFNELIESVPPQYQSIVRNDKERFLDDVINRKLLYREALERKLDKNEETQKKIADMIEQILINAILIKEVKEKVSVSEEEMKLYYESHKAEFQENGGENPAKLKDYSAVKGLIKGKLITEKNKKRSDVLITELRDKSKLVIHKELLETASKPALK